MFLLILRQLLYAPFRTFLTCVAVASALAVILLLEGFQSGLLIQLRNVSLDRGADLIVAQKGVSNFIASRSLLPQVTREIVEGIDGVKGAHPITSVPVIYERPGYRKSPIFFVVYDTGGGPTNIIKGKKAASPRDIVIDESLAVIYDLDIGDSFIVADFEFRIAGIAEQSSALFTAFAFISYDDMIDFFFDSDLVGDISNLPLLSYLLVELHSGADRHNVAAEIERLESEADVFLPEDIAANDVALGEALFGPVLGVLIGAGYIIALLVVGMIMFAAVHARMRIYGVMKALGFSNRFLNREIILESLAVVVLSFPVALALAQLGAWIIELRIPLYLVPIFEPVPLMRTFVAAIVLGIIGAYLPYRFIARLDTAIVFRG